MTAEAYGMRLRAQQLAACRHILCFPRRMLIRGATQTHTGGGPALVHQDLLLELGDRKHGYSVGIPRRHHGVTVLEIQHRAWLALRETSVMIWIVSSNFETTHLDELISEIYYLWDPEDLEVFELINGHAHGESESTGRVAL